MMPDKVKPAKHRAEPARQERLTGKVYERELYRLQAELVKVQEWVRQEGARLVVLFDRSWYNRAGVERVMGFCTHDEYRRFLHQCPIFERLLVEDGILLRKYWFSVSDAEQEHRFRARLDDPMRRWKLSPMDLESISRWEEYSRSKDEMFLHTDIPEAPWNVAEAEGKRRARINMIAHLLSSIPYVEVQRPPLRLPPRPASTGYRRTPREMQSFVPDHAAAVL